MRRIIGLLLTVTTIVMIFYLDKGIQGQPLGRWLSPTHGLWNNAPATERSNHRLLELKTPHGKVQVYYDERAVPHIYAQSEQALYFAQGYVQAADRLWQMDIQTRIAEGRFAEVAGPDVLDYDRFFRRSGIPKAADDIVEALKEDTLYQEVVASYTAGVNAYIDKLQPRDYPLEFKLLNYSPEHWTLKKSVLLLKLMAFRLSGYDTDVLNSNTLSILDRATFDDLFPDWPKDQSPIIPSTTRWRFQPVAVPESPYSGPSASDTTLPATYSGLVEPLPWQKGIGSNNWAVGSQKTANGGAILCNDPHLGLTLPSIWYEMQLIGPGVNVYGVTIPGSPCIIIGFNEDIAWGVTNGSRDVRDWFSVRYKDDSQKEYLFEGEYREVETRLETIRVKGQDAFTDTVRWTKVGPVMYDRTFGSVEASKGLAVHWLALEESNELKTFYYLNKAKTHADYLAALNHYANPAQNFVYADRQGNIAIKQQGNFRVKHRNDGKFVEPLEFISMEQLSTYIPSAHNPYVLNPPRGFVSSANQHPTDSTYPYHYGGWYERYRNRRINALLTDMTAVTAEDMMRMQNDSYNLMGQEMLDSLLIRIDRSGLDAAAAAIYDTLSGWDHFNRYNAAAPSYFQDWFIRLKADLLDELYDTTADYRIPLDYETFEFLFSQPDHPLIDNKKTAKLETRDELIRNAFSAMTDHFAALETGQHTWQHYNGSSVIHLLEREAFSHYDIPVSGSENAVNANIGGFGPSWRMIVELNDSAVSGYGVYPGGPSGNPGDPNYDAFIDAWAEGSYFKLNFYHSDKDAQRAYEQGRTLHRSKEKEK